MELNDTELNKEEREDTDQGNFFKRRIELKKQKEKEERIKTIKEYSLIIDSMPEELKQMLTSRMGNVVVTPQESFFSYFSEAIPKYEPEIFNKKFVETFEEVQEKAIKKLLKGKKKKLGNGNDLFWEEFEILFDGMKGSKKSRENIFTRLKILIFNIWTILKVFKRAVFGVLFG